MLALALKKEIARRGRGNEGSDPQKVSKNGGGDGVGAGPATGSVMPPQHGDGDTKTKAVIKQPVTLGSTLASPVTAPSSPTSAVVVPPKVKPTPKAPAIPLPALPPKSMVAKSNLSPATATPTGVSVSTSNPGPVLPPAIAVSAPGTTVTVTATRTTTGNSKNNAKPSIASQLKSLSIAAASSCWAATTSGCEVIQSTLTSAVDAIRPANASVVVHQPQPTSNLGAFGSPTITGVGSGTVNNGPPTATANSSGVNTAPNVILFPKEPSSVPLPPLPPKPSALSLLPSWKSRCSEVYKSASLYKTFPVFPSSFEYNTIVKLLSSLNVTSVESVVNPDVWARFINAKREMLISKTDDVTLLKQLGLDDMEIARCQLLSAGFTKKNNPLTIATQPFSPNEALLFHCTKDKDSLETILRQGLDERLSVSGRRNLGSGIYFSDDPKKCLQYDQTGGNILIFIVLLGDCLAVDNHPNKASFVRGPEKGSGVKRSEPDMSFDSITARPYGCNEYVIFNRNQCCPLYLVRYTQEPSPGTLNLNKYELARMTTPDFVWRYQYNLTLAPLLLKEFIRESWPFFASFLLKNMGFAKGDSPIDKENGVSPSVSKSTTPSSTSAKATGSAHDLDKNLPVLQLLGFVDKEKNKNALARSNNDLVPAINFLMDNSNPPLLNSKNPIVSSASTALKPGIHVASGTGTGKGMLAIGSKEVYKPKSLHFPDEDCTICYNKYPALSISPSHWVQLRCRHLICKDCYNKMETTGRTMSGVKHTSIKCPFCNQITGIQVGDCPNGTMTISLIAQACAGYPAYGSIKIQYLVDSGGYKLNRIAYLPYTDEGHEVLKLLRTAWDRRLCFVIGTSITTGQDNVLVWNIHHKTNLTGGTPSFGYPDPDYFRRVKWELKAFGIE